MSNAAFRGTDQFLIRGRLGAGAMGVVYRAYDRVHRVEVALKTLRELDGASLYRFKNEFRALSGFVHENLVTLYELQSVGDDWFFTMELVEGVSFLEYVRPHRHLIPALPEDDTRKTAQVEPRTEATAPTPASAPRSQPGRDALNDTRKTAQVGPRAEATAPTPASSPRSQLRRDALVEAVVDRDRLRASLMQLVHGVRALHRAGKLHRDIKPSNVLVDPRGRVVVCDFGLVADVSPTRARPAWLAGTPGYMSPEQAIGGVLDPASDWYSVGVMAYEALTGRLPFTGTVEEILEKKRTAEPEPPRHWDESIDEDLDRLCVALLSREPSDRPSSSGILEVLAGRRPLRRRKRVSVEQGAPFVGRDAQRAALADALRAVGEGRSAAVLVHGRSGMGKTALLDQFLREVESSGDVAVLKGRCYERESVPYKALDGLVDALSNLLVELPPDEVAQVAPADVGALARIFPVLRRVEGLREAIGGSSLRHEPQDLRLRAFGALHDMLAGLAERQPVVVCIDDLQWGDVDSAFFLEELLHRPASSLLFIGCYRSDEADSSPLLRALLHGEAPSGFDSDVREIGIDALSREESRQLALALLADATDAGLRNAEEIARETGGSPFFVTELARAAKQHGAGAAAGRVNLDDVLRRRITDLPEDARALLTASAVAGRPTPLGIVSRAAGVNDEPSALALLLVEHLVRTRSVAGSEEIEPFHDRIREVATGRLSERGSRRIHRRLARAFEASERVDPQALVEHWLGAGVSERAGHYAVLAAEQAEEAMAFHRAAHHYRLALELLELDDDARRAMRVRLADALANRGSLSEAAEAYLEAAADAEGSDALELRRRALQQLLRSGRNDEGLELAREVLRDVGLKLPRSHRAALLSVVFSRARLAIRGIEFKERPPEQIRESDVRRLDVFWSVGSGLSLVDPLLGTAFQMRNLVTALRVGEPYRAALALSMEIGFRSFAGGRARDKVMRLVESTRQLAEEAGSPHALGVCLATSGLAQFSMGDFDRARQAFEQAETTLFEHGVGERWDIDVCRNYRMGALWYLGRIREFTRTVLALLREAVEVGDEFLARGLRSSRSNAAWLVLDAPGEARRQVELAGIDEPERAFHMPHFYELMSQCQIELYEGDGLGAWQRLDGPWRALKRSMLVRRAESIRIASYFLRARCALAAAAQETSDRDGFLREARIAARRLAGERNHWNLAKAALVRGCVAALQGDAGAAVLELEDAARRFEDTDMALHAAVTRLRLGELRGGQQGAALRSAAEQWMQSEGIEVPQRMARMFVPRLDARAGERYTEPRQSTPEQ